jgi:5'-nucleotidase
LRILLTNDDGIHAPGLVALEKIARTLSDDLWVCAPEYEQSGASRALTLAEPIVRKVGERRFATTGTPTDCVMLGIHELVEGGKPDLVLSGVNRGANLAEDVTMSGTVAGAIEAMALGVPGIALSQMGGYDPHDPFFEAAETFGAGVVRRLVEIGWPADVVMNINFPQRPIAEITEVEVTRQGFRDVHVRHAEKRTDLRGREYYWIGFRQERSKPAEGTDLRALYDGKISVTPLHIDLTHAATINDLKGLLGGAPPKA